MKMNRTNQRGQAVVEYVLLLSFVLLVSLGEIYAMQIGFWWVAKQLTKTV